MGPFLTPKKQHNDPSLKLNSSEIQISGDNIWQKKNKKQLTFILLLKSLKSKCNKTLQLLRVAAHKEWGADRKTIAII